MILHFLQIHNKLKKHDNINYTNTDLLNKRQIRYDYMNLYEKLSVHEKNNIINVVDTVSEILIYYSSIEHTNIYPDWLNLKDNKNNGGIDSSLNKIYQNIGYYTMTHIIDEKYKTIPQFSNSINKLFQISIWHIASNIDFEKIDEYLFSILLNLFDAFCLLSRTKAKNEFEKSYKSLYKFIVTNNYKIKVPIKIYNVYSKVNHIDIFDLIYHFNSYQSISYNNINPIMFFYLLVNKFTS